MCSLVAFWGVCGSRGVTLRNDFVALELTLRSLRNGFVAPELNSVILDDVITVLLHQVES
jgi:hypothetical protein